MAVERSRKPASRKGTAGKAAGPAKAKAAGPAKAKAKASTSYSPAPMSAEAKKYAGFRAKYINSLSKDRMGTATKSTARKPKAGSSTLSSLEKRLKTIAREARDIPTAVGTAVSGRNVGYGGGKFAAKDLKTQLKEVASAAKSGKKGTEAAQVRFGGRKKGTVGAGSLDQNVSKPKGKRK